MTYLDVRSAPVVALLGPLEVRTPDGPRPVPARLDRLVLARLVLAEERTVSVDTLVDAIWGEDPPANARNALQVKVSRLRRLLGDHGGSLSFAQGAYRLALAPDQTDLGRFTALVAEAEAALDDGAHTLACDAARASLALWRGEPLTDLDEDLVVAAARRRLHELWLTAREVHAETQLRDSATRSAAIGELRDLLGVHPLRPRARLALMRALELAGRRADALAVYDAGRRVLAQETGLEPPAELQQAFAELLAAERRAARRTPAGPDS